MQRVFVYGTLKRGLANHDRIFYGHEIKISKAWTSGNLYDTGWGFPAMISGQRSEEEVEAQTDRKVHGELIEFEDDKLLEKLDRLEGFIQEGSNANFYDRIERSIHCENGELKAWVYVLNPNRCHRHTTQLIQSGIWG